MEDLLFCLYVVVGFIAIVFVIQVFNNNKSLRIVNDGLRAIVKQDGITRLNLEKEIMICNQTNKDLMELLRQRPSKSENQEELIKWHSQLIIYELKKVIIHHEIQKILESGLLTFLSLKTLFQNLIKTKVLPYFVPLACCETR